MNEALRQSAVKDYFTVYANIYAGFFLTTGQICNIGMDNRKETELSSVYQYDATYSYAKLTADKALNGNYSNHPTDCAGSAVTGNRSCAWWRITFQSVSKIFKINLIFREFCKCP